MDKYRVKISEKERIEDSNIFYLCKHKHHWTSFPVIRRASVCWSLVASLLIRTTHQVDSWLNTQKGVISQTERWSKHWPCFGNVWSKYRLWPIRGSFLPTATLMLQFRGRLQRGWWVLQFCSSRLDTLSKHQQLKRVFAFGPSQNGKTKVPSSNTSPES